MSHLSLDLAFARLGASIAGRQRPSYATAGDGSLVLVCRSSGFSRPGEGVLRYSASLSATSARSSREAMRLSLDAAREGRTPVRMIVHTAAVGSASSRLHIRPDLIGNVSEFDGDAYTVDFVRIEEPQVEPPVSTRRRR